MSSYERVDPTPHDCRQEFAAEKSPLGKARPVFWNRLGESYWRRRLSKTARAVKDARLTYLSAAKLYRIERCLAEIDRARIEGDCVEFGVALGGSGILIAKRMAPFRRFVGFDLFGTIPPPSDLDGPESHERYRVIASGRSSGIGGDTYYGYEPDLFKKVNSSFAEFGVPADQPRVRLAKGLFQETVSFDARFQIAFAHVDCDWYDPVALCLDRLYPHLTPGGIVVLDDYNDYGGCRKAVADFLARHADVRLADPRHNAILRRD